jgi:hypothetical protein
MRVEWLLRTLMLDHNGSTHNGSTQNEIHRKDLDPLVRTLDLMGRKLLQSVVAIPLAGTWRREQRQVVPVRRRSGAWTERHERYWVGLYLSMRAC